MFALDLRPGGVCGGVSVGRDSWKDGLVVTSPARFWEPDWDGGTSDDENLASALKIPEYGG